MKNQIAILVLVMLAGCAPPPPIVITSLKPTPYEDGKQAGCQSGLNAADASVGYFSKNIERFHKDAYYADGWRDGFETCKGQRQNWNATVNSVFGH